MTDLHEYEAMRAMWRSVAATALRDDNRMIAAARRGRSALIDGRRVGTSRAEVEIDRARRYYHGHSWREVCKLAGISCKPVEAMKFVLGGQAALDAVKRLIEEAA